MIKAEELNEFLKKKGNVCDRHTICGGCPLWSGRGDGYCAAKYGEVTQGQIDAVMAGELSVDWSKVAVDTKVLVRDSVRQLWLHMHFAGFKDGLVETWTTGTTSWTSAGLKDQWKCAKLAEEDER